MDRSKETCNILDGEQVEIRNIKLSWKKPEFLIALKKEQEAKAKKTDRTKYEIKQPPLLESKYLDYLEQVYVKFSNLLHLKYKENVRIMLCMK